MARTKIVTTIYIEQAADANMKALAAKTGVPAAALIRRAIDAFLAKHRDVWQPVDPVLSELRTRAIADAKRASGATVEEP